MLGELYANGLGIKREERVLLALLDTIDWPTAFLGCLKAGIIAVDLDADETDPPMRLEAEKPILTAEEMEKIRHIALFTGGTFRSLELDICYPAAWGAAGMEAALASGG